MNITSQIIAAAKSNALFSRSEIKRKADILNVDKQFDYFKNEYDKLSVIVIENEFSSRLSLKDILLFGEYEKIGDLCRSVLDPFSPYREIKISDAKIEEPVMGPSRTPIVGKHFDFSRDTEKGSELTGYLTNLYTMRWLKQKMGYDTSQYPYKHHLVVFKQNDIIYIRKNDIAGKARLYIDKTSNEKILDAYQSIYYHQKGTGILTPFLDELPYKEGEESQKIFDLNWYKRTNQTPLTYRCFPNIKTMLITPDPNPEECKHSGEYCINKEELELRYARFLNIYNAIDENSKQELLTNTIELFERFFRRGEFEKAIHKMDYENIIQNLNSLNNTFEQYIELDMTEKRVNKLSDRSTREKNKDMYIIKKKYFNIFLDSLEYSYPHSDNPIIVHGEWQENLLFFKKETLDNLIYLDSTATKAYLGSLKFEFEELNKSSYTTQKQLNEIYLKYETTEEDILSSILIDHPLHNMLTVFGSEWREKYSDPYFKEVEKVQRIFYNFHYGKIVKEAFEFLKHQESAITKDQPLSTENIEQPIDETKPSMKVISSQKKVSNNFQLTNKEMKTINPDSRYFKTLQTLINLVDSDRAFKLVYNEDKRTNHLPYLYKNYKNEIVADTESEKIYIRIKKVFSDNLFKPNEILLLIGNLMPAIEDYGKKSKSALGFRLAKTEKGSPLKEEYQKTIVALNEIKDVLKSKLGVLYKNLLRVEEYKLKFTELEKIQDELFKSYAMIIVKRFNLMKIAFEGAIEFSIDPDALIKYEISIVDNIILKGEHYDIILKDRSSLCPLNPPIISEIYHKLVRGLEIDLIDEYASDLNSDSYDELINTKALIMYKEFIAHYKLEKTNESSFKPQEKRQKKTNKKIYALKWTADPEKLEKLFNALVENEIIVTDVETFKKAFSGELLEEPLKIRWNFFAKRNKKPEIKTILYFLDIIKDFFSITETYKGKRPEIPFYDAVENTFVDVLDNPILRRNIRSTKFNSNYLSSDNSILIDNAIKESGILLIK